MSTSNSKRNEYVIDVMNSVISVTLTATLYLPLALIAPQPRVEPARVFQGALLYVYPGLARLFPPNVYS